jgi:hypothetical protein
MHILTTYMAIVVLVLIADGEEYNLKHRGRVDSAAMDFEATHLSTEQCDNMNYVAGRRTSRDINDGPLADTTAAVENRQTTVKTNEGLVAEKAPAWISELQQKGKTYKADRKRKAKINEDRLSAYSKTELSIARYMGLPPWEIDREQLRIWAQEIDSIPLTF